MTGGLVLGRAFSVPNPEVRSGASVPTPPRRQRATYGGGEDGLSVFTDKEIVLRIAHLGPKQKRFLTTLLKDTFCAEEGAIFRSVVEGKLVIYGDPEDGSARFANRYPSPHTAEPRDINHG